MTEKKAVFNQLNIVATDYTATIDFYRRLGVEIPDSAASPEGFRHIAIPFANGISLEIDNAELARFYHAGWRGSPGGSRLVIGFLLLSRAEVDQKYKELMEAGYTGRQPPYDAFWGARYAIVADPDGNDVGLMSPIDDERRTWPPDESPSS
jgi:catechol 2,3-dioxygenase-like lactoylglutathione lyase family enzyme